MGLLCSMSSIGMAFSLVWGALLQKVEMKNALLFAVGLNALGNLLVGYSINMWVLYSCKFVLGATQGIVQIWTNCWINSYCPQEHKTLCLTLAATVSEGLGSALGTAFAGYSTSSGVPYSVSWYINAGVMWFLWCGIMCVSGSEIETETKGDTPIFPVDGTVESSSSSRGSNGCLDHVQGFMRLDDVQEESSKHGDGGLRPLCHGLFLSSAFGIASISFIESGIYFVWVGHFSVAWGVSKTNSITLLNLLALIGSVAGLSLAKTVDIFGGCKTSESTSKTMKLLFAFMFTSVCGAIVAVCAIYAQLESLNTSGKQALSTDGNLALAVCYIGMLINFIFWLATLCGLLNVNVSALPLSSVRLGQGFTISLKNLLGFFMGPLLPRVLMQILEDYHVAKANAYCYSTACVLLSALVPLFFIFCGWSKPVQLCKETQDGYLAQTEGPEICKRVQHPCKFSESTPFAVV